MGIRLENLVVKFGDFNAINKVQGNQLHYLRFLEYINLLVGKYFLGIRM